MIYFDNAATTRALPAVAEKMSTMLCEQYGNPASVSAMGLAAEKEIRNAAEIIARGIHCKYDEVILGSRPVRLYSWHDDSLLIAWALQPVMWYLPAAARKATTGRFTARQRAIKDRDSTLLQRKLNTLR